MKIRYYNKTYTQLVRVEIKNIETREFKFLSFIECTLDEVIQYVKNTIKPVDTGVKVQINIRESHQVKKWSKQKNLTICIESIDMAIAVLSQNMSCETNYKDFEINLKSNIQVEKERASIEIKLGNIGNKEQAEKIERKLTGKTFYNFQVHYASSVGNYPVTVTTDYPNAVKEEVIEMLLFVLASEI